MRQTGKTFRAVLRSVAEASGGKYVVLVCATREEADVAMRMAKHFTSIIRTDQYANRVEFRYPWLGVSGGLLVITHRRVFDMSNHRGIANLRVVIDE